MNDKNFDSVDPVVADQLDRNYYRHIYAPPECSASVKYKPITPGHEPAISKEKKSRSGFFAVLVGILATLIGK